VIKQYCSYGLSKKLEIQVLDEFTDDSVLEMMESIDMYLKE
jgi:hypothetical protein